VPAPEPPGTQPVIGDDPFSASLYNLDWDKIDSESELPKEEEAQPKEEPPAQAEPPEPEPATKPEDAAPPAQPDADTSAQSASPDVMAIVENIGGTTVLKPFSDFLNAPVTTDQEATVAGRALVEWLNGFDNKRANGILNGVYELFGDSIGEWYASEHGITPELIQTAKQLAEAGIDPADYSPKFPEPDSDKMVDLDGETLNLDNNRDRRYYEMKKSEFNAVQEKARQDAENEKNAQAAQARQQAEAAEGFYNTRLTNLRSQFDGLNLNFGEGFEFLPLAIDALSQLYVQQDQGLQEQLISGMDVASRGGEAAKLKGEKIDLLANAHLKKAVDQITGLVNQINTLKAQLAGTSPRVTTPPQPPTPSTPPTNQAIGGALPTPPNDAIDRNDPFNPRHFRVPDSIFR